MEKLRLTEGDRHAIVQALQEKAEADDVRAAELEKGWPETSKAQTETGRRLAFTFREQAKSGRELAEKVEGADTIELV